MKCSQCGGEIELPRQLQRVADLLLEGSTNDDIAKELGISPKTVKQHMRKLFIKYGIKDGMKRVKLAVAIYYDRNPHMRPRIYLAS